MVLNIKNQRLSKSKLESRKFNENIFSDSELLALKLAKAWLSGEKKFRINTSGSTGQPKKISLNRQVLEYSARRSIEFLDPDRKFKKALLCINPLYIGGIMVVIRSLLYDYDLTVIEPTSNPIEVIGSEPFDLVSMVPLQVQSCLDSGCNLSQFHTILIGGAALNNSYLDMVRKSKSRCFQTYGMTETASHIALRELSSDQEYFSTLGNVTIGTDSRGCLKLSGTVTNNLWFQTNDMVEIIDDHTFKWLGRADFVINSGGFKVHPEMLEQKVDGKIREPFFIAGIPDNKFGERVILLVEGTHRNLSLDLNSWHPYEKPKEIHYLPNFIYTSSGKINRRKTLNLINK